MGGQKMPTADHVREFLQPLDEDPVLSFRDEVVAAAAADPEVLRELRSIASHFERHVLSKDLPDDGPEIGGILRRATPLVAAGYLRANDALKRGGRVGNLHEAIAKTQHAVERVEPDFAVELGRAIQRKRAASPRFRERLDAAAAVLHADLGNAAGGGSPTALAKPVGGGGGDPFCVICANGNCSPGTEAECLLLVVIIIVVVVVGK